MKTAVSTASATVSQALTKGTCPICAILKDFQWTLAETTEPHADLRMCNFHVWALARSREKLSRSTPGEKVTDVFLEMLKGPFPGKASADECALCHRVVEEEVTCLRELAQRFQSAMFVQWMTTQGSLCLSHGLKLKEFVPIRFRPSIDQIVERNRAELEHELDVFRDQLRHGVHEGGGILGRVAEFLVGQRGL